MITIDGSMGEGGGQILRSALALAAVTGRPVRIEKIRAGRPKPGLGSQHLAAARAAAEVCGGDLEGDVKGSTELVFRPGPPKAGDYRVVVGTAGSTTLVFQTLLPVLAAAESSSTVLVRGGTHNPMAPPADFVRECYLPALGALGIHASCRIVRHGFYPKGGGEIRCEVKPWHETYGPLDLAGEVSWEGPDATVLIADLPEHVAEREAGELLRLLGIGRDEVRIEPLAEGTGPGNAVMVGYSGEDRRTLITAFGAPGKRAEEVAREAAEEARAFAGTRAPVDPFLADQLLLPMALGPGGSFTTPVLTEHARTHAGLIRVFLGVEVESAGLSSGNVRVTVPGSNLLPGPRDAA